MEPRKEAVRIEQEGLTSRGGGTNGVEIRRPSSVARVGRLTHLAGCGGGKGVVGDDGIAGSGTIGLESEEARVDTASRLLNVKTIKN